MQHFLQRYSWLILAAGALIQILTGIPSAWGSFQKPVMEEYAFSEQAAGYSFTILLASYGIGCAIGGFFQDKFGPRKAALVGTVLLCAGVGAAGLVPEGQNGLFYMVFSVPAGVGSAFLYPAIMSCAQKWYADKKGLATGVIGGAMGLSGLFLTAFVGLFTKGVWQTWGIRGAFFALALFMLPICLIGSLLLQNPQEKKAVSQKQQTGKTPKQMLRTANYWYLAGAVALSTPAVQLFSPILVEMGTQRGLQEGQALWAVMLGSVGNALGRLTMPMLSDKIGRKNVDQILFVALLIFSGCFWFAPGWWMIAVYVCLTVCYSGLAAVLPAFATDLFGMAHSGINYGLIALGQTVGSLSFPLLADALGLEQGRHALAMLAAAAGFIVIRRIKMEKEENTDADAEKS